jgi:hypothetical protein
MAKQRVEDTKLGRLALEEIYGVGNSFELLLQLIETDRVKS